MVRLPGWLEYEMEDKLERVPARKWINEHPEIIVVVAFVSVVVLVVTGIVYLWPEKPKPVKPPAKAWFYDLNTGELFTASKRLVAPIETDTGPLPNGEPAGVRAYVLSYAAEPNESNRFIGFLEKADPFAESSANPGDDEGSGAERWGRGKLIRRVEDLEWVPADSMEGREILEEAFTPDENGERPHYVRPR
ncbi:MAG: hypothetical protein ACYTBJ_19875 [Planctomycetota bacterium]|jgi:hypothetical protein